MPEWIKWFFDGFGTQIIFLIIGAFIGGIGGFYIGKRNTKMKQKQEAGSDAGQLQVGIQRESEEEIHNASVKKDKESFKQIQKAGDDSKQIQIGGQNDD